MASDEGQTGGQTGGQIGGDAGKKPGGDEGGRAAARFLGLGFQFAAAVVVAVFAGQWIDRRFGTDPWGVLLGAFAGFGAGFYSIYRTVMGESGAESRTRNTPGTRRRPPGAGE